MTDKQTTDRDYLICLLDVLGFENLFAKYGLQSIEEKYNELIEVVIKENVDGMFISSRDGHPFFGYQHIDSAYFSDTIIFWCGYNFHHLEVLSNSLKEVICRSIEIGLPLRGAISVGKLKIDKEKSIFLGQPIISAARVEVIQKWIGVTFSKEFRQKQFSGGFKADTVIQYEQHVKDGFLEKITPIVIDFPRHWRLTRTTSIESAIESLNIDSNFAEYYTKTLDFAKFSKDNHDWWMSNPDYQKEMERRKKEWKKGEK